MAARSAEERRAYNKAYYKKNATRLKKRSRAANKHKTAEQRQKARERAAAWYRANKKRAHAAMKKWAWEHPEKVRAYHKKVLADNPGRRAYHHCLRRSRELQSDPPDVAHLTALSQTGHCFYCNVALLQVAARPYNPQRCTVDHKIPVSRGGTNARDNLVAACARCNFRKGRKTVEEFAVYLTAAT